MVITMSRAEVLMLQYEGQIVPKSFEWEFVVLSYFVSWIGAILTLELLNRRTLRNGFFNYVILIGAAVAMGAISIYCMHFVGERALTLGQDEPELRIDYSSTFSILAFLLPVMVLCAAFLTTGANKIVSWWRICCGGVLAGLSICGMHYLGNASIYNYQCEYSKVHIVGAALTATFDSITTLSLLFVFRASWRKSWWKRALVAFLLAGGISAMHWIAALGTDYRLLFLNERTRLTQAQALIIVSCLAFIATLFLLVSALYASWVVRRQARKARQVVLAAAVFDHSGRVLVDVNGLIPSEKITDTYVERNQGDTFNTTHPFFHWMFRISRNWSSVNAMISGMTAHLERLRKSTRDNKIRLIDDDGQLIDDHDVVFRELFCVAAVGLAVKLEEQLVNMGILWEEILTTGVDRSPRGLNQCCNKRPGEGWYDALSNWRGNRTRKQEHRRGSLMFLVRRVESSSDVKKLEAAGFRFADTHQVCEIITTYLQIKTQDLNGKLKDMATFAEEKTLMEPGVHLGFFGVKARTGSFEYDVVVRKGARNLLPTIPLPLERVESWQMEIIRQFDRMSVALLFQSLAGMVKLTPREVLFASQLCDALQSLRAWIDDPIFDEAVLASKVVQVPCRAYAGSNSARSCTVIALCLLIPNHASPCSPGCEFLPLSFFKVHQMVYRDSPQIVAFARYVHRELSPIVSAVPINPPDELYQQIGRAMLRLSSLRRLGKSNRNSYAVVEEGYSSSAKFVQKSSRRDSSHSESTIVPQQQNLRETYDDVMSRGAAGYQPLALGGIMISQEIQVDVQQLDDANGGPTIPSKTVAKMDRVTIVDSGTVFGFEMECLPGAEGDFGIGKPLGSAVAERGKVNEDVTFVDELFAVCLGGH